MIWSARASSDGGIVRPRAFAILQGVSDPGLLGAGEHGRAIVAEGQHVSQAPHE